MTLARRESLWLAPIEITMNNYTHIKPVSLKCMTFFWQYHIFKMMCESMWCHALLIVYCYLLLLIVADALWLCDASQRKAVRMIAALRVP